MQKVTTKKTNLKLRDSLRLHIKLLLVFGLWKPTGETIWVRCYKFYSFLVLGLLFFYVSQEVVNLVYTLHCMHEAIGVLFWLMPHLPEVVKAYYFYTRSNRLKDLVEGLDNPDLQPRNQRQRQLADRMIKSSQRMHMAYLCAGTFTVTIFTIRASSIDGKRRLPLVAYIPFSVEKRYLLILRKSMNIYVVY